MSVFSTTINHRSFSWQLSILCFVLGLLLAASAFTTGRIARSGIGPSRDGFVYGSGLAVTAAKAATYESEIKKLNQQKTEMENKLARGNNASTELNKDLQDTKVLAGLTELIGSGIQVTLNDTRKQTLLSSETFKLNGLIHDSDINGIINELKASGAEAIAINGQRLVGTTAIRCAGPVVVVNGVPKATPFVLQAIGDPDSLFGGMNLPDGVLADLRRFDPEMARVEKKAILRIPAYSGGTQLRFAHVPK